jgi:GDP/UDP-N,N'-diacetylbacillosamine 2-epimerase (hydrolysing)
MSIATAETIKGFTEFFEKEDYRLLIVLGDRFEIFGAAFAAAMLGIPIAHLYGGDTTEGAVDEFLRHSITKMSYLHFTSSEVYRKRVIQLGEAPDRVFNVGSMGVENALALPKLSLEELEKELGFKLCGRDYAVVTYHPVTLENSTMEEQMYELIAAMDAFSDYGFIITRSNADAGGRLINEIWERESAARDNWYFTASLGAVKYLSALKYSKFMLGNSSSGISEAPSMKIPTVNIGDRQKGRVMADSLICCSPERGDIISAMKKAAGSEFQDIAKNVVSPFGDGNTSDRIIEQIRRFFLTGDIDLKKKFYDL